MRLYIVRHAYAGQHGDPNYPDDDLRPLTKRGRKEFGRLVRKLVSRGLESAVVATSPLVRCRQTADLLAEELAPQPPIVELDALRPGSRLGPLVAWSNEHGAETLAWVGHAPDVDHLASEMLGTAAVAMRFAKGAVAAIDFEGAIAVGQGELRWFVAPKLFSKSTGA